MTPRGQKLVAFFLHAPGLKLFAKRGLPAGAVAENVFAVAATVVAMVTVGVIAPASERWPAVLGAWALGHLAWGWRLAALLAREASAASRCR